MFIVAVAMTVAGGGVARAGGEPYESPLREKCDEEIRKDGDWYRELADLFTNQLFFDPRTGESAPPEAALPRLPEHEAGYTSPMRAECTAEMKKDTIWMAKLRAYFDGRLSYDFQTRNSKVFTKNKQHVIGAYAAILIILVGFLVVMFLRQRKLMAEIERLREDVERAASE